MTQAVHRMKALVHRFPFGRRIAKASIRRLLNALAWNHPQLYLRLIVWWVVRRSGYYELVQNCRAEVVEIPLQVTPSESGPGHSRKRILYVIHWYDLGGAESYALYTITKARELGHDCFCISTVSGQHKERAAFQAQCVETLHYRGATAGPGFRHFVADYIREHSIDVVHIHHSALMYEALPGLRQEFPRILIVDSTHIVEYYSGGFPRLSAQYADYIDTHNVISKNLIQVQQAIYRETFGNELEHRKFCLTYLSSLSKAESRGARSPNRSPKVVTFYGRLVLQKQPNIFIATIEHLIARHPELDVEAHIYGEGEMQDALQSQISRSKCCGRFRFFGRCDDKRTVFENSDILLLTSLNEGLSLTAYEALSYNRLVVSSDVGAQSELLCQECLVPLTSAYIQNAAAKVFEFLTDNDKYTEALAKSIYKLKRIRRQEVSSAAITGLYASNS